MEMPLQNPMTASSPSLQLWGGVECTINRVGDRYFNQTLRSGHRQRGADLDRFAALGIRALRYPVLWEQVAPNGLHSADWRWTDERLQRLRALGIEPIAGLLHHGSGPRGTSLTDPAFPEKLEAYAAAVAQRYPWLTYYTPVNEPLTTARFSGLYGIWYPHGTDDAAFLRALVNQCKGTILAMRAIRRVNPDAQLVQTDDLGKTYSTKRLASLADFYNERRWLGWDLLCGMVDRGHALWPYLRSHGIGEAELDWFLMRAGRPDIIGANYYVTSERWLDHRAERFDPHHLGKAGFIDIEASRVLAMPTPGIGPLLDEVWQRYGIPIVITETHIDSRREDQLRWLMEVWNAALAARERGVDVPALTVWALLGSYDWNCLVTEERGYYEPGAFDLRAPTPRPTAIAQLMRELATGRAPSSPVLQGAGWWRRADRFFCVPSVQTTIHGHAQWVSTCELKSETTEPTQPLLIVDADSVFGAAAARLCTERDINVQALRSDEVDIGNPMQVDAAIRQYKPWAIINPNGDVVQSAQGLVQPATSRDVSILAAACALHNIKLLTFSSAKVFDGSKKSAYVEADVPAHREHYAAADGHVLHIAPDTLIVRSGPILDLSNLEAFSSAVPDEIISPALLADFIDTCLGLLIDGESGLWHVTSNEALTWRELAEKMRQHLVLPYELNEQISEWIGTDHAHQASVPKSYALGTERGVLLPTLDAALTRHGKSQAPAAQNSSPVDIQSKTA
jgi:dTDP-4-dehydrorhamnose reductase